MGCISSFSKKTSSLDHTFTCFCLCCLCPYQCFAFLFYSQPANTAYNKWPVQVLSHRTFDVSLFNLLETSVLIEKNLPIFSMKEFFQKARKQMSISMETIIYTELCLPHRKHHHILNKTFSLLLNQFLFTMKFISVAS